MIWRRIGGEWRGYRDGVHVATVRRSPAVHPRYHHWEAQTTEFYRDGFATGEQARQYTEHMVSIGGAGPLTKPLAPA